MEVRVQHMTESEIFCMLRGSCENFGVEVHVSRGNKYSISNWNVLISYQCYAGLPSLALRTGDTNR